MRSEFMKKPIRIIFGSRTLLVCFAQPISTSRLRLYVSANDTQMFRRYYSDVRFRTILNNGLVVGALVLLLLIWLLVALCLFSSYAESGRRVTQQELGDRWPLRVESGYLDCDHGALLFRHDGTSYALNMTGNLAVWKVLALIVATVKRNRLQPSRVDLIQRFSTISSLFGHPGISQGSTETGTPP